MFEDLAVEEGEQSRTLIAFLDRLRAFLILMILENGLQAPGRYLLPDARSVRIAPEHLAALQAALQELLNEEHFEQVRAILETGSDEVMQRLHAHGLLSREQVNVKATAVQHREVAFRTFGGFSLFRRFVDAIDTFLKSILQAAGAGGAIEEIKDTMLNLTEEEG